MIGHMEVLKMRKTTKGIVKDYVRSLIVQWVTYYKSEYSTIHDFDTFLLHDVTPEVIEPYNIYKMLEEVERNRP
jgi:hypothetical protein